MPRILLNLGLQQGHLVMEEHKVGSNTQKL